MSSSKSLINLSDGIGFVYHPQVEGKERKIVAIAITKVNAFQKSYLVYDRDSTLIASVDNSGIGFGHNNVEPRKCLHPGCKCTNVANRVGTIRCAKCQHTTTDHQCGRKILFNKNEVQIITQSGNIERKFDPKVPLSQPIVMILNENLELKFTSRFDMKLRFKVADLGIDEEFDCSYTPCKTMEPPNPLKAIQNRATLLDRQRDFTETMKAKYAGKNFENDSISGLVDTINGDFKKYKDTIESGNYTSTSADPSWRSSALNQTLSEVKTVKFTNTNNLEKKQNDDSFKVDSGIAMGKTGSWLGEVEVREKIRKKHPDLKRTKVLSQASGRYSDQSCGASISHLRLSAVIKQLEASAFENFVDVNKSPELRDKLIVVCCLREDERKCREEKRMLQVVDGLFNNLYPDSNSCPFVIRQMKMTNANALIEKYNIRALPMYLIFFNGSLVEMNSFGGRCIQVSQSNVIPRLLYVEPRIQDQMRAEKVFTRAGVQWDLTLSAKQAIQRIQSLYRSLKPSMLRNKVSNNQLYGVALISADIPSEQVAQIMDSFRSFQSKMSSYNCSIYPVIAHPLGTVPLSSAMCSGCRSEIGSKGSVRSSFNKTTTQSVGCPHCGIIERPAPELLKGGLGQCAVMYPMKPSTITALHSRWKQFMTGGVSEVSLPKGEKTAAVAMRKSVFRSTAAKVMSHSQPQPNKSQTLAQSSSTASLSTPMAPADFLLAQEAAHFGTNAADLVGILQNLLEQCRGGAIPEVKGKLSSYLNVLNNSN